MRMRRVCEPCAHLSAPRAAELFSKCLLCRRSGKQGMPPCITMPSQGFAEEGGNATSCALQYFANLRSPFGAP